MTKTTSKHSGISAKPLITRHTDRVMKFKGQCITCGDTLYARFPARLEKQFAGHAVYMIANGK